MKMSHEAYRYYHILRNHENLVGKEVIGARTRIADIDSDMEPEICESSSSDETCAKPQWSNPTRKYYQDLWVSTGRQS